MVKLRSVRKKTQVLLGALTLACGFFMMWGSAKGSVDEQSTQRDLFNRSVEIDPWVPQGSNNGSLVLVSAPFKSSELLEDDFLKAAPYLILRRRVEMYQWTQELSAGGSQKPTYRMKWNEGQVDFFSFQEMAGHENPLIRVEGLAQRVNNATFGAFNGAEILGAIKGVERVELTTEMLKDTSLRIQDNMIYLPRDVSSQGEPRLGDMRIWYEGLPQGDYTVLTVQRDERNLVGAQVEAELVVRRGALTRDEFFARERSDAGKVSMGLLQLGAILFFAGLCSVLSPFAPGLSLRPHLPVAGMGAVAVISAGLALLAMIIFLVSGYLS